MNEFQLLKAIFARVSDPNPQTSIAGIAQLAKAVELPIQKAVFPGDIFSDLFKVDPRKLTDSPVYRRDLIAPGSEKDFYAYPVPHFGEMGQRVLVAREGVRVPTFEKSNAVDLYLRDIELEDFDSVARALEILEAGIVMDMNDVCWSAVVAAAAGRNRMYFDDRVVPGRVSKRLLTSLQIGMRRSAGGNGTSMFKFKLGRLYMSPELRADLVNLTNADLDDVTRQTIVMTDEGKIGGLLGLEFRDLDELGVSQKYQNYFTNNLSGSFTGTAYTLNTTNYNKAEILIGVDTGKTDKMVLPVTRKPTVYEDLTQHRAGLFSLYARYEYGAAVLDNRVTVMGAA